MSGGAPSVTSIPVQTAADTAAQDAAAKASAEKILMDARGRSSTILTSGEGVLGAADTKRKTLLGGGG